MYWRVWIIGFCLWCVLCFFLQNVPQLDEEGFCIRPEVNENDILTPDPSLPSPPPQSLTQAFISATETFSFISFIASTQCKLWTLFFGLRTYCDIFLCCTFFFWIAAKSFLPIRFSSFFCFLYRSCFITLCGLEYMLKINK